MADVNAAALSMRRIVHDIAAFEYNAVSAGPAVYIAAAGNADRTRIRSVCRPICTGTEISYPLVQGTDNDYYLTHTWNQNSSAVGAIFMDCRCSADFSGFNTIVYGHRMNNGSMFAALKHYKKQDFLQAHPQIYVTNASGTHAYSIYAAYEAALDGTAYYSAFSDETIKKTFIDEGVSLSVIRTGAVPTVNDHILTLSTCTGNGHATRWVVQAIME